MARLNIEDSLWGDPRFQEFMIQIGNRHMAKGMVIELWSLAQKYWLSSRGKGIPRPVWEASGISDKVIECGLASDNGEFIYATGSKDQFAWLEACSEGGKSGGPAAAKARREIIGKSKRRKSSDHVGNQGSTSSYSSSFSLSSSFSDSGSSSISEEEKNTSDPHSAAACPGQPDLIPNVSKIKESPMQILIATYCELFKSRYRVNPEITNEDLGVVRSLIKSPGLKRSTALLETYFTMTNGSYLSSRHSLFNFKRNINDVKVKEGTGTTLTRTEIRQAEDDDFYKNQMQRVMGGP